VTFYLIINLITYNLITIISILLVFTHSYVLKFSIKFLINDDIKNIIILKIFSKVLFMSVKEMDTIQASSYENNLMQVPKTNECESTNFRNDSRPVRILVVGEFTSFKINISNTFLFLEKEIYVILV